MEGRRAGRAGGPCFQMKNVNCRRAGGQHRRQAEWRAGGLYKKAVRRAAKKDQSKASRHFAQPSLSRLGEKNANTKTSR